MRKKRLTSAEKQMAAALDVTDIHFDDEGRAILTFQGKLVPPAESATAVRPIEIETDPGKRHPWPGGRMDMLNGTEPE